jgi:hypothetical protein
MMRTLVMVLEVLSVCGISSPRLRKLRNTWLTTESMRPDRMLISISVSNRGIH